MKSKINKIIRSAAIATVGVLSLCSCNDFLTITPSNKTVLKDYWKTKDDVDQMVNGAYYKMLSGSIIERFIMWGDYRSDELQKYQSINNSTLDNISNLDLYPSSGYNSWAAFYNVINTCNLVMKHAPAVIEIDPNFTEGDMQTVRAQMLALRALCHFYLVRSFRDIPYVTQGYENTDDLTLDGQLPPDSTLQRCINDLEEAETGCYQYGVFGEGDWRNYGLFSKDAVNATLADIYLWRASMWSGTDKSKSEEYYQKCIECVDKVLASHQAYYKKYHPRVQVSESNPYSLYDGRQAFYNIFGKGNSEESILELQFNGTNNSNDQVRTYYYKEKNGASHGLLVGTSLVGMALSDNPTPAASSASVSSYYQSKNDYRYYDNSYGVNAGNATAFEVRKMVDVSSMSIIPSDGKGYSYNPTRTFDNYRQNWIVYRITDLLLMKAEAQVQLSGGNDTKLQQACNIVRMVNSRSIMGATGDNKADTLVYKSNYDSQKKMELLCLQERGRELCYEGKRWYDLVRYSYRHMKGVDPTKTLYELDPNGSLLPSLKESNNDLTTILATRYLSNIFKLSNEGHLYWPILHSETKNNPLIHQNPVWVETKTSDRTEEK